MALHTELPIYRTGVRLLDLAVKAQVQMPRTMTECHRLTERRGHEILRGVRQPHDVVVTAI